MFFKKRRDKRDSIKHDCEQKTIDINTNMILSKNVKDISVDIENQYSKPEQYDRHLYDDGNAKRFAKETTFSGRSKVYDPYTKEELFLKQRDAKLNYGTEYAKHSADADHIQPIKDIVDTHQGIKGAWLSSSDIKEVANRDGNFQIMSASTNRSKGSDTQDKWLNNPNKTDKLGISGNELDNAREYGIRLGEEVRKQNDKLLRQRSIKNAVRTGHQAGLEGGMVAATHAGAMCAQFNIVACIKGEKTAEEACIDVGETFAQAGLKGYVHNGSLEVINHTLSSANSDFLNALGDYNVASKAITAINVTGDAIKMLGNNEINTEQCLTIIGGRGCGMIIKEYSAAIGQTLIPIPGVGGLVGFYVGNALSDGINKEIMLEIQRQKEEERRKMEEMLARLAEEERKKQLKISNMNTILDTCKAVSAVIQSNIFQDLIREYKLMGKEHERNQILMAEYICMLHETRNYRKELEASTAKYLGEHKDCFKSTFDFLEDNLSIEDYGMATKTVNLINRQFGGTPYFETADEFKKMMSGEFGIIEI